MCHGFVSSEEDLMVKIWTIYIYFSILGAKKMKIKISSVLFVLIASLILFGCGNVKNTPTIENLKFIYPDYLEETGVVFSYDEFYHDDETLADTGLHTFKTIEEGWEKIYKPDYVRENPSKYYAEWLKSFADYSLSDENNMYLLFYRRDSSVRAPLKSAVFSASDEANKLEIVEFIPAKKAFSSDYQVIVYLMEVPQFTGKLNLLLKKYHEYNENTETIENLEYTID